MGNACAANPEGNLYDDDDVEEESAQNLNQDLDRVRKKLHEVLIKSVVRPSAAHSGSH
jgi:hypothetical protein